MSNAITNGELDAYSAQHNIYLAKPEDKAPACHKGEYHRFTNDDWKERFQPVYNLGLHLGKYGRSGLQLMCIEADSTDQEDKMDAFIKRHRFDPLVFRGDKGGYKHYIMRYDPRLAKVTKYEGFEVKTVAVIIPPSRTSSGQRKWRAGDEERFIKGDIPKLPESFVEEILRSKNIRLYSGSNREHKVFNRIDWDMSFLTRDLKWTQLSPNEYRHPNSHSGYRTLELNYPEPGWISVFSTSFEKAGLPQGRYPVQVVYARLMKKSMQEAHEYFNLEDYSGNIIGTIEYTFEDHCVAVVRDLKAVKLTGRDRGEAYAKPTFIVELYLNDELAESAIECSTADDRCKQLAALIQEKLFLDDDDTIDFLSDILNLVDVEVKRAVENFDETSTKPPKSFTLAAQEAVVNLLRSEMEIISLHNVLIIHPEGKYYYNTMPDEMMRPIIRAAVKRIGLPTCRDSNITEVLKQLKDENKLNVADVPAPYNRNTGRTDEYLIAYDDKPVRLQADGTEIDVPLSEVIVLDALPYTQQEIADADTSELEKILEVWFPSRLKAENERRMFKQVMGIVISNYRPQAVVWIKGKPGSGKSSITEFLIALVSPARVKILSSWDQVGNPFAFDQIGNASLVICQDLARKSKEDGVTNLKVMSGERQLNVNAKHQRQASSHIYATIACASNYEPPQNDEALLTRIKYLPMNRKIRGVKGLEINNVINGSLLRDGLHGPAAYKIALEGLKDHLQNGFPNTLQSDIQQRIAAVEAHLRDQYEYTANPNDRMELSSFVLGVKYAEGVEVTQKHMRDEVAESLGLVLKNNSDKWFLLGYRTKKLQSEF